ncbi:glycosyltransferase family 39 protein [Streptomyces sp. NPDC006976]|uniref:glycosyltransferase family 39 protein n=1 Tax=Streptomyces sp. NPDC006976 TaxID=3154311 RepID=UPI0034063F7D
MTTFDPAYAPARPDTPPGHVRAGTSLPRRAWRGRPEDAPWVRPAFLALLLVITLTYFWNLGASGYANSFYSAAVQAGSQSWKAFFFGSLDSANAITVDKPPATLWPMALSVRVFGLSSWAILAPQVLMAAATAGVLYAAVRRRFSAAAGLITMAVFALTPVAALMFRFNNPDALLALLMTVTVYCVLRAMEHGRTKWLVWAGVAVGLAFLSKTLQAFLILPPLAVLYAVFAPVSVRKRFGQLGLSALAMAVAGGWWVAIVELWPASSRPYIGGSQNNSFLELTFGYNGLGRINGDETGSVGGGGGGGGGGGQWGETGLGRMFNSEIGSQISWLLPAALILLVAGVWLTWRGKRTDTARAAFLAWGSSLLMTAAVFSFMAGIFHQYYTVALAPYIAALIGMGVTVLWEERARWWAGATLAAVVAVTAYWAYVLLGRTPDYQPWLRTTVLVAGLVAAVGLLLAARLGRRLALAAVVLGFAASLAAPTAYTVSTLNTGHQGSIVTAGPSSGGMGGPGGGGRGGGPGGGGDGGGGGMGRPPGQGGQQGTNQQGNGMGRPPTGTPPGQGTGQNQGQNQNQGTGQGQNQGQAPSQNNQSNQNNQNNQSNQNNRSVGERGGAPGGGGGGMGGLLNGASVGSEARKLLEANADDYTWAAAAIGSQNAASYQLATEKPVMAIGGFNGSDPSPTLAQFEKYVEDGRIHYFVSSGEGGGQGGGGMGGSGTASEISSWVEKNFKEVTVGSATFYDLTRPATGS